MFVRGDIGDPSARARPAREHGRARSSISRPRRHVDRSIDGPAAFVDTNVVGTFALLEGGARVLAALPDDERDAFRFLHVSTDEVYGSLGPHDPAFTETTPYAPNSPYCGVQGGVGSPGARLSPHLRAADAHHQLLQQLRPATSFPKS